MMLFNRCWRRLLRVLWTARRSNQSILTEISPEYSLEGLMLKLQYSGYLVWRADSLEKTLILGKIEVKSRREWQRMRWLDSFSDGESTHSVFLISATLTDLFSCFNYICWSEAICCSSVSKLFPTLCNPMNCSSPGSSVFHYLLKFDLIHIHWVKHAI